MLTTETVQQIPTDRDDVLAFRIGGHVEPDDVSAMAAVVNRAFDTHDSVSILLQLHEFGVGDAFRSMTKEAAVSQMRSLGNVEKYAVLGAPAWARAMIEGFGKLIPTEARTFDPGEVDAAWSFVGARPATTH